MLNRETGEVTCDYCGEPLGNYLTGDFYKLIRLKYCPTCKQKKKNRQDWRTAQKDCRNRRRKKLKEQKITIEELMKIVVLLKEQNKLLRRGQEGRNEETQKHDS